jgi:hypothetical protein
VFPDQAGRVLAGKCYECGKIVSDFLILKGLDARVAGPVLGTARYRDRA